MSGPKLDYDGLVERMRSLVGQNINVHIKVIVAPDTTMPAANLTGSLAYAHPVGQDGRGNEEGVLFGLESDDPIRREGSFYIWRSDLLTGSEHGDGVAWRAGPLLISVSS